MFKTALIYMGNMEQTQNNQPEGGEISIMVPHANQFNFIFIL